MNHSIFLLVLGALFSSSNFTFAETHSATSTRTILESTPSTPSADEIHWKAQMNRWQYALNPNPPLLRTMEFAHNSKVPVSPPTFNILYVTQYDTPFMEDFMNKYGTTWNTLGPKEAIKEWARDADVPVDKALGLIKEPVGGLIDLAGFTLKHIKDEGIAKDDVALLLADPAVKASLGDTRIKEFESKLSRLNLKHQLTRPGTPLAVPIPVSGYRDLRREIQRDIIPFLIEPTEERFGKFAARTLTDGGFNQLMNYFAKKWSGGSDFRGSRVEWEANQENNLPANLVNFENRIIALEAEQAARKKGGKPMSQAEKDKKAREAYSSSIGDIKENSKKKSKTEDETASNIYAFLQQADPAIGSAKKMLAQLGVSKQGMAAIQLTHKLLTYIVTRIARPDNMSPEALAANISMAVVEFLMDLLLSSGPSAEEQILKAIQDLREEVKQMEARLGMQINDLETNVLRALDRNLEITSQHLREIFKNLKAQGIKIEQGVKAIQDAVHRIDIKQDQLALKIDQKSVNERKDKALKNYSRARDLLRPSRGTFKLKGNEAQVQSILSDLAECIRVEGKSDAVLHANRQMLPTFSNSLEDHPELSRVLATYFDTTNPGQMASSYGFMEELLNALKGQNKTSTLPNLQIWGLCADAYVLVASAPQVRDWYANKYLNDPGRKGELSHVLKQGKELRNFIDYLRGDFSEQTKILETLNSQINQLKRTATEDGNNVHQSPLDIFRGAAQINPNDYQPTLTINLVKPCAYGTAAFLSGLYPPTPGDDNRVQSDMSTFANQYQGGIEITPETGTEILKHVPYDKKLLRAHEGKAFSLCISGVGYTEVTQEDYCNPYFNDHWRLTFSKHRAKKGKLVMNIDVVLDGGPVYTKTVISDHTRPIWNKLVSQDVMGYGQLQHLELQNRKLNPWETPAILPPVDPKNYQKECDEELRKTNFDQAPYFENQGPDVPRGIVEIGDSTVTLVETVEKQKTSIFEKLIRDLKAEPVPFDFGQELQKSFNPLLMGVNGIPLPQSPAYETAFKNIRSALVEKFAAMAPSIYRQMPDVEKMLEKMKAPPFVLLALSSHSLKALGAEEKAKELIKETITDDQKNHIKRRRETISNELKALLNAQVEVLPLNLTAEEREGLKNVFSYSIEREMQTDLFERYTAPEQIVRLLPFEQGNMNIARGQSFAEVSGNLLGDSRGNRHLDYSEAIQTLAGLEAFVKAHEAMALSSKNLTSDTAKDFLSGNFQVDNEELERLASLGLSPVVSSDLKLEESEFADIFSKSVTMPFYDPYNPELTQIEMLEQKRRELEMRLVNLRAHKKQVSGYPPLLEKPLTLGEKLEKDLAFFLKHKRWN